MPLIECVPNISEGRRLDIVEALLAAVRRTPGAYVLDHSSDPSHNRAVLTLAGERDPLKEAVLALYAAALPLIDLRAQTGVHPRVGAVDVVPFIPLEDATMGDCVTLAREVGAAVAERFGVPVFLYEEAATSPDRRNLENIRRGEVHGLTRRMASPAWAPDFGPPVPHPTAGVTVIGARMPLIAYNINLNTDRVEIARAIARRIRQSSGGLPFVKAIGVTLAERHLTQVSINLTNHERTPVHVVFEAVARAAEELGVSIAESELIGLMPASALYAAAAHYLKLGRLRREQVLEERVRQALPTRPPAAAGSSS